MGAHSCSREPASAAPRGWIRRTWFLRRLLGGQVAPGRTQHRQKGAVAPRQSKTHHTAQQQTTAGSATPSFSATHVRDRAKAGDEKIKIKSCTS